MLLGDLSFSQVPIRQSELAKVDACWWSLGHGSLVIFYSVCNILNPDLDFVTSATTIITPSQFHVWILQNRHDHQRNERQPLDYLDSACGDHHNSKKSRIKEISGEGSLSSYVTMYIMYNGMNVFTTNIHRLRGQYTKRQESRDLPLPSLKFSPTNISLKRWRFEWH